MNLSHLAALKTKVLHDKGLGDIWQYFMDNLALDPEFIALGHRIEHEFIQAVLSQVGRQLFPRDGVLQNLVLTLIPEHNLIHGGFALGGRFGGVIFYEDEQVGMFAVPEQSQLGDRASDEMKFIRFSGRKIRKLPEPSLN